MILGIVLVVRDISREKKLAQLRDDFISNVTHELKTPLTSIRMFAETMLMGRIRDGNDEREYLSVIVNESERLTRLINTVLDASKIDLEEKQYHMRTVNLSVIVRKAVNAMSYWLKENGFEIIVEIEQDIMTTGDEDALEQTVNNLLSNAMKYSHHRKEITIRLHRNNGSIRVEVQDRGIGIPESKQSRIFEKYYRAHPEHNADRGGSGLGLAVVKHIVDAHEGTIELKSKVNGGTTVTIVLPQKGEASE
jgi:two-component system phosphate regulon sensor histidine kinase PhoR